MKETIKNLFSRKLDKPRTWVSKGIRYVWIAFLCILLGLPLFIFSVQIDLLGLYGGMPNLADVENPENDLSSEIISSDGVSLGRYFRFNRSQVT
jgi:penicillin-binding protein 1A